VVIEDADGQPLLHGHDAMRERYGRLFAGSPDLHAEIVTRIRVGSYVIDEERISGRPDGDVHAVAIYRLDRPRRPDRPRPPPALTPRR